MKMWYSEAYKNRKVRGPILAKIGYRILWDVSHVLNQIGEIFRKQLY